MSRHETLTTPVRTEFGYHDLELVAQKVYALFYEHLQAETIEFDGGYNRSRVLREAVESVAGY